MKKYLFTVLASLILSVPAHAGIGSAAKAVGEAAADSSFVAAVTHSGPGFSFAPPVGLLFLATHDVFSITDRLKATVGVDVRSEYGFASSFGNLGIGGGFRYKAFGPVSIHAGYARSLVDFGAKSPDSDNRVFVGIGISRN